MEKSRSKMEQFAERFGGQLILPEDKEYDEARRPWNSLYDRYPVGIARCRKPEDIVTAVNFVRDNDMLFSVRGGGHDYAGNSVCDDGLVIDLAPMNEIEVDAGSKRAIVGGGATVGEFDAAAQKHGLATPTGTVSSIGIGGLALGGGTGYLSPRFGLTLDNIRAVEIVTAEGRLLTASEKKNEDLFWAVRGGGGNFGIVTSFTFQLHKVGPKVLSFQAYFPHEKSREVLQFYRDFIAGAPKELQCFLFFLNVPPLETFPQEYHGKTTCALIACYSGDPEEGKKELKPLEDFGRPFLKFLQSMDYTALQKSFDAGMPKGLRWYSKAHYLPQVSNAGIEVLQERTKKLPGPFTMAYLEPTRRAVGDTPSSATAFPHRDAAYSFHILSGWSKEGDDEQNISWTRDFHDRIKSETSGGVYVNLLGHDEKERVPAAYGANYSRLVELKKKWDPENLFRGNHNIIPL